MANVSTPWGFAFLRSGGATPYGQQLTQYSIPTSDSTNAYYMGDAVKAANGGDTSGVPNVVKCVGTEAIRGIIIGISPVPIYIAYPNSSAALTLENNYVPATKANPYYLWVADDATDIWMMQDDGITTGSLVAASCNYNAQYTVTNGATTVSSSASVILSSSMSSGNATYPLKLLGLAPIPNNVFGAYAKWQVRINVSELTGSFAGI